MSVATLDDEQLAELGADLQRMQAQIAAQLERSRQSTAPVTLDQQSVGRLSRMDAMQQQAMAQAGAAHLQMHLRRVLAALAAIQSGDYGFCRQCDEPIGYARLKARPDTPLCVACQSVSESR